MSTMSQATTGELTGRLDFIRFDAETVAKLSRIKPVVERHLDEALTKFYDRVEDVPAMARFFRGREHMNAAKGLQAGHWAAIAAGAFDEAYFQSARRIGDRHAQIGLEPRWYIGGYALIFETLVKRVLHDAMADMLKGQKKRGFFQSRSKDGDAAALAEVDAIADSLAQLLKAMLLDMDISVSTYFDRLRDDAAAKERLVKDRIDNAVAVTGKALRRLADCDLSARIVEDMDGEFEQIREDANAVSDRLSDIVGQLRETSGALKTATSEILAGANDLSERTTRQAATIEETSAAVEQLSAAVAGNAQKANEASAGAEEVSRTAADGATAMREASGAMERITHSSAKISDIIRLIDDVAFQTNLLALNASVEAARAGEAGKGFAVVAVEVRRLAQSAAEASNQVKSLIEKSAADINDGARHVGEASTRLNRMLEAAGKSNTLMQSIARDSQSQAAAIEEVNSAIHQMDEMTQHNAALVEETNAAIEQTEAQASELDRIVAVFSLGGPEGSATPNDRERKPHKPRLHVVS